MTKASPFQRLAHPLTHDLLRALETEQDDWSGKSFPSPSVIGRECTRQLWYMGTRTPPTDRIDASSILAMKQGQVQEQIVVDLLAKIGRPVLTQVPLPNPQTIGCTEGTADGMDSTHIMEFKRLGMWRFLNIVRHGLFKADPTYYSQIQLYMRGLSRERTFLIATSADYSAIRWFWKRSGYHPNEIPPPIWVEEVPVDNEYVDSLIERARVLTRNVAEVPYADGVGADFDPRIVGAGWPCGWCSWRRTCTESHTSAGPLKRAS